VSVFQAVQKKHAKVSDKATQKYGLHIAKNQSISDKQYSNNNNHHHQTPVINQLSNLNQNISNNQIQQPQRLSSFHPGVHFNFANIQTKFKVSQPGDIYEQEANRVAEEVMQISSPSSENDIQISETNDKKVNGKCKSCREKEKEEKIIHRKTDNGSIYEVSDDMEQNIYNMHNNGSSLDRSTQEFMESRFGFDFSKVKIHTDEQAAVSADAANARAYTVGHDIVFGAGQYAPGTAKGRQLLAHELTHVIQQRQVVRSPAKEYVVNYQYATEEQEAKQVPTMIMHTDREINPCRMGQSIHAQSRNDIIQRDILAYNKKHEELYGGVGGLVAGGTHSTSSKVYTGDAVGIMNALQSLITANKVGHTNDGLRTIFFNKGATITDLQSAFTSARYPKAGQMASALIDNHNVYIYSRESYTSVFATFWEFKRNKKSHNVEQQFERPLTDFEKSEAQIVFGNKLNFNKITIAEDAIMSVGGYARALPHTIYFPPGSFGGSNFMPWLMHELTHSWQWQHGVSSFTMIFDAVDADYDYGGAAGLIAANNAGKKFRQFTTEEQADIVRDYYVLTKSGRNTSAWQHFINQL
jgi:hypothetical protein